MADAGQSASPASVVATGTKSETPKTEHDATPAPEVKTEAPSQTPEKILPKPTSSESPPNATQQPISTASPGIKTEPANIPESDVPSKEASPVVPPSNTGTGATTTPAAVATPVSIQAPIPSPLSIASGPPPPAESSVKKRSRSPETAEGTNTEKRQKTETAEEQQNTQDDEMKVDSESETNGLFGWDLGAQLSSVLGSVETEAPKDVDSAAEEAKLDALLNPLSLLPPPRKRPEKMKFIENPTYFSRAMALPMLGSLSVQILLALFQQPSEVTDRQIRDVRTEGGKVYSALRQTFMAVLKLFTDVTAFLSADDLDIHDPGDRETIQMANLASMCASFYGPGGPTMATAHDNFLKIMIPENGMITEDISALYLDQKTQSFLAYANVMEDKESTRISLMDKFFPLDLEEKLRGYWRDSNLAMSADDFVKPFTDRRNLLKAIGHDKEKRRALETKYQFATFLDNLSAFIRSNFDSIMDYAESHGLEVPNEAGEEDLMLMDAVAQSSYQGSFPGQPRRPHGLDSSYDSQGLASLITEKLNGFDGYSYSYGQSSGVIPESPTLPPTQSLPTSVLYERARQAAVAKSSAHARREGLHSTRRPWTPEEEKALMAGLDMVKGPHWSQILQLFGQNGTISDILKDRTQVQLKDKCVTGELKTRAPSQAARKEAEEQARVHSGGPSTYSSSYTNGGTNGPVTHGLPISSSPRPQSTTVTSASATQTANNTPQNQSQHPYQSQQHSYQQQRPQQFQQANGTTRSPVTPSQQGAPKPLAPQSQHHQPIAPAPSYQRPLQQAAPQPRPMQQPGSQAQPVYHHAQQQAQRPPTTGSPASSLPPRATQPSTTSTSTQPRPPAPAGQAQHVTPRPGSTATTTTPRPASIPAPASGISPAAAPAPASKSVPTIMPAPPTSTPPAGRTPAAKPAQSAQPTASSQTSQPAQHHPVQTPAPAPSQPSQPAVQAAMVKQVASHQAAASTPNASSGPPPAGPPPVSAPSNSSAATTGPKPASEAQTPVDSTGSAEDDLLAKTLKAVLDSG